MAKIVIELTLVDDFDAAHALELVNAALDNGTIQASINDDCNCAPCVARCNDEDAPLPIAGAYAEVHE